MDILQLLQRTDRKVTRRALLTGVVVRTGGICLITTASARGAEKLDSLPDLPGTIDYLLDKLADTKNGKNKGFGGADWLNQFDLVCPQVQYAFSRGSLKALYYEATLGPYDPEAREFISARVDIEVLLSALDPSKVATLSSGRVILQTTDEKPVVFARVTYTPETKRFRNKTVKMETIEVYTRISRDSDSPSGYSWKYTKSVENAFRHAIELSGGRPSEKDPFAE